MTFLSKNGSLDTRRGMSAARGGGTRYGWGGHWDVTPQTGLQVALNPPPIAGSVAGTQGGERNE